MSKTSVTALLCSFLALPSTVTSTVAAAADYAPEVGQPHANLVLPKISDRQPVSLAQFRGSKVLLIQFASW